MSLSTGPHHEDEDATECMIHWWMIVCFGSGVDGCLARSYFPCLAACRAGLFVGLLHFVATRNSLLSKANNERVTLKKPPQNVDEIH